MKNLLIKQVLKRREIKYINDIDNINKLLGNTKFNRIILRENYGTLQDSDKILGKLKTLLSQDGFIYLKTLVFRPIERKFW